MKRRTAVQKELEGCTEKEFSRNGEWVGLPEWPSEAKADVPEKKQ